MKLFSTRTFAHLSILSFLIIAYACKKEVLDLTVPTPETTVQITDAELFELIESNNGYTYFEEGNTIKGVPPSPHGDFKLRFNSEAASVLNAEGIAPAGTVFPENSIIVKEILSGGSIALYAVMQKQPADVNTASGWIWGEYEADGKVLYGVDTKGSSCTGCHSENPNRDLTRVFDLH